MFNDDFYPSPEKVKRVLLNDLHIKSNYKILEPSAGKGDLIEGLKCRIDVIEKEYELCSILQGKGYSMVGYDFLTYVTNTEYDLILMNPPFSEGCKHLLKAIDLAENQVYKECNIRCILNAETLRNPYSNERKLLCDKLNLYGAKITYYDSLFTDAERKTNVETVIIEIDIETTRKKVNSVYESIVNSMNDNVSEYGTELSTFVKNNEMQVRVENIELLVKKYEYHVKLVKDQYKSSRSLEVLEKQLDGELSAYTSSPNKDINDVIDNIRNKYWRSILNAKEFADKLTADGRQKLYQKIEQSGTMEITIENVKLLLMGMLQNSNTMLLDSCLDLFEKITKNHMSSFSSNIHYYNGWKTNNAYKINKKVIIPFRGIFGVLEPTDMGQGYFNKSGEVRYENVKWEVKEFIDDLMKMFKLIQPDINSEMEVIKLGEFENEAIKLKMFSKGTVHFWFKDLDLLDRFNILCGQHFNWIPTDEEIKTDTKAKEFMNSEFKNYMKTLKLK